MGLDRVRAQVQVRADGVGGPPFATPPLARALLLRVAPDEQVLALTVHHVASDGWSKAILRRELATAYNALARGSTPHLPALPIQVLDHAAWQRATLDEATLAGQLAFWRDALADLAPLELPADRPRPATFSHRGARVERTLDEALTRAIGGLAQDAGASVFMVLLAAFDVVLARATGQSEVAVGAPIAGRDHPECEGLVGFFVNTLVLRQEVDEDASFRALLAAVKARALAAFAHADLPFERLVGELNPPRDPGRHPLVQVVLALQNTPWDEVAFDGLEHAPLTLDELGTRLDLELHVWPRDGRLRCHLVYATDLFERARVERLLASFERLVGAAVAAPDAPLATLEMLSPDERRALVAHDTARPEPTSSVPAMIAAIARRDPDRLALTDGGRATTYAALWAEASAFAAGLAARGVGVGARVGVALERSRELIVAELAAMIVGAAYVPLDPDYPAARVAAMVAAADVAVVVAASDFHQAPASPASAPAFAPAAPDDPERVAYVIFTSGSSGRPHAVPITHRGLANTVAWYRDAHGLGPDDRVPWLGSPSFDASVLETWPVLTVGGSLHVVDRDARLLPARLLAWLSRTRITLAFLPTALVELVLELPGWPPTLRAVTTGGDRLLRRPPPAAPFALYNLYGPTEASVVATSARVEPGVGPIPIGWPIANTRVLVVDARARLVPDGAPGELWIGGVGLAPGYLGEPELSARRFVDSPWGRFYRSGDRVRRRADGALEFLGRLDQQVKIRGVRVEPGEVDAALAEVPGVAESLTIAREDSPGDRRLVSYLALAADRAADRSGEAMADAQVERWRTLYDAEYGTIARSDLAGRDGDPTFEIQGWNSSLTGRPIPADEMREWVDAALATVLAAARAAVGDAPPAVLEIGCGTGLILFPLAARAARYAASDLSVQAIAHIRRHADARVRLAERPAHDLGWLPPDERFDVVVLNSVVQYFPSEGYLLDVLERLLPRVAPGGRVVIGDVRNLDLADAFHLAVERARDDQPAPPAVWRERVREAAARDQELLASPDFFRRLPERWPRITAVAVAPKRGRARNELTWFRFEVTLTLDAPPAPPPDAVATIDEALASDAAAVRVEGLADARAVEVLAAQRAIVQGWSPETARPPSAPIDLEVVVVRAAAAGRRLAVRLGPGSETVTLIVTRDLDPDRISDPVPPRGARAAISDPLGHERRTRALSAARAHLAARLPEVMMPAAFVFLDRLPRAPTGKLERHRLPAPPAARPQHLGAYAAPAGPLETIVADVFRAALGFETIGRDDDFFALGGHSLLAVEVVTRLEERLAREVPLAALFAAPTVAGLALRLDEPSAKSPWATTPEPTAKSPSAASASAASAAAPTAIQRLPFTPMDVAFHYGRVFFGAGPHAWYQVMELELARHLDRARLTAAVAHAVERHPMLRARPSDPRALGREVGWLVAPPPERPPLEIHEVPDARAAAAALESLIATPFAFGEGLPFRFVLIAGPERDTLVVRYHHAAVDGSGLACLARTVMSHYLGRPDPDTRVLTFSPAELVRHHAPDRARAPLVANREVAHLAALLPAALRRRFGVRPVRGLARWPLSNLRPAPLHGTGGDPDDRTCERVEHALAPDTGRRLDALARRLRTTLDRLFLVGLLHAAGAWNRREDGDLRRVETYWAVNLRPANHFLDVVGNQFAWSRVSAPGPASTDDRWARELLDPASDELVRGAIDWLRTVDGFHHLDVPDALRGWVMRALRRAGPTMCVSNTLPFGELDQTPLGTDFGLTRVGLHSRFFFADRPVVVIGRRQGTVHLRLVYPRAGRDASSARRFLAFAEGEMLARLEAI